MPDINSLILDSIFDTLPSGMIFWEVEGSVLRVNQKAKEILGLNPQFQTASLNQELPFYLSPLVALLKQAEQDVQRAELSLSLPIREEDSVIGFSIKLLNTADEKTLKVFTFTDITQLQKDQLAMEKIKDELNQSKKLASIGTMIAGVAHEMNNPLTGISMSTSLLKMNLERLKGIPAVAEIPKLSESIEKGLQEIQKIARASEKAAVLVNDLLAYSKPSQLVLVALPLQDVVSDIISALKCHPHFSQFSIEIEGKTNRTVLCDRIKLEQVFYNLVKNACDATQGQGQVTIGFSEANNLTVTTHVKDNGPGIDKTLMSRIFDPFFTTKGHSGVGLGLSICYRTLEQHGGLLSVDSVKGEGTEFKMTLPLYLEEESAKRLPPQ
ncbi:nitrogen regulation protein NR(II) [Vampirovibrio sp.]|uniref:two-component system sensor histidine kinase NtrB n=1 Tax=Vampirovibrio sp. TaxID=2717857 RepID=UPI003594826C